MEHLQPRYGWVRALLLFVLLGLAAILSIIAIGPPSPLAADASADQFSAARANTHILQIAAAPHPMGAVEHQQVRDYLQAQLTDLGLESNIQTTSQINEAWGQKWKGPFAAGRVHNVLGRLPGSANTGAILLLAHYDSVPNAAGASDDGAGVAAILETLRTLKMMPQLRNDVIVLFSDGEEAGLLGALAFVQQHPWAGDVKLVLNFEARGTSGPSVMFETSAENGWLIENVLDAAPHPLTNSLSSAVYDLLPNDTDLTIFKEHGYAGLNFAYFNTVTGYHTQLDTPEQLDQRSLQHHGSYALALSQQFGNADLSQVRAPDAIYFNLIGSMMVSYPGGWAIPLAVLALLGYGSLVAMNFRKQRIGWRGLLLAGLWPLALAIAAALLTTLLWLLLRLIFPGYQTMTLGDTYNASWYKLAFTILTILLGIGIGSWWKRSTPQELFLAALGWWAVLALVASISLPGASYCFVWTALLMIVAEALLSSRSWSDWGRWGIVLATTLPIIVMWAPILMLLFNTLTLALGAGVIVVIGLLAALLLPIVLPPTERRPLALVALVGTLIFLVGGMVTGGFDAEAPRPNNIAYVLDADSNTARWATTDRDLDEWTATIIKSPTNDLVPAYLPTNPKNSPLLPQSLQMSPAESVQLSPPELRVISNERNGEQQILQFNVRSPRSAPLITLTIPQSAQVISATLANQTIGPAPWGDWELRYWAAPTDGITLTVVAQTTQPIPVTITDQSYGLPEVAPLTARPETTIPAPYIGYIQDTTMVIRRYQLEPAK